MQAHLVVQVRPGGASRLADVANDLAAGHVLGREKYAHLFERIRAGNPHAVLTVGLFVLTLGP